MNAKLNINNVRNHYDTIGQLEQDAASRETSVEIMYAIAERANDYAEFQSIWSNGTYRDEIVARAWELADDDTETLFWGCESFEREMTISIGDKVINPNFGKGDWFHDAMGFEREPEHVTVTWISERDMSTDEQGYTNRVKESHAADAYVGVDSDNYYRLGDLIKA